MGSFNGRDGSGFHGMGRRKDLALAIVGRRRWKPENGILHGWAHIDLLRIFLKVLILVWGQACRRVLSFNP